MRKFLIAAFAVAGLTLSGANLRADDAAKGKDKDKGVAGILIDKKCGAGKDEEGAAGHPASCALKCADAGLGVVKGDKWIKFDEKGQKLAKEYLTKHKDDKDATKVHVAGKLNEKGDEIAVEAIHAQSEKDEKKKES
jgi:hypothetical protein